MVDLITVAGGLFIGLLLVGAVMYLVLGDEMEWESTTNGDNDDPVSEAGVEE